MTKDEFAVEIRRKDYNAEVFLDLVLSNREHRDIAVDLMVHHEAIMVYYHCYEVLKEATRKAAGAFTEYYDSFRRLLGHKNSYHRDFGLTLLANLTAHTDSTDFAEYSHEYFRCLDDRKFMTAQCCLGSLNYLITHRNDLTAEVVEEVLEKRHFRDYKEKQQALIHGDVLEILQTAYCNGYRTETLRAYVADKRESASPKTRKLARRLYEAMT